VHRLLKEYSDGMPMRRRQQLMKALPEICAHSSQMEQRAMEAERDSVRVMQVEYMKRHLGEEFHAVISGVTHFGIFVEVTDLLVEGLIRVRDLEDDYYVFDEKNYAFIGRRHRKRYRLGDKVRVQVVRVDPEEREIDFAMVE
jgi:ribonuclease R